MVPHSTLRKISRSIGSIILATRSQSTSLSKQVQRIRLSHAMHLLKEKPEQTVTEIALSTGFSSSQNFATRFKKHYQRSPQQVR